MPIPPNLKAKYLKRLDELIKEGAKLHSSLKIKKVRGDNFYPSEPGSGEVETFSEYQRLAKWKRNCITLLEIIVPTNSKNIEIIVEFGKEFDMLRIDIPWAVGELQAIYEDFDRDFFNDIAIQVEAEVVSDLMGQAEELLDEGQQGKFDYVPAAVLAGATLEKSLKTLCGRQTPPISVVDGKDRHKKMDVIISDLKKAGLYVETKAKQLRVWAGIRNDAAHGDFDKFEKADVEDMIKGINRFLADYL
ncbi:MAG: DUF4145 domain-containing protein [Planctomycetota bacterium]|jgi:hypothetical protein